jgi:hypothetical protein
MRETTGTVTADLGRIATMGRVICERCCRPSLRRRRRCAAGFVIAGRFNEN